MKTLFWTYKIRFEAFGGVFFPLVNEDAQQAEEAA